MLYVPQKTEIIKDEDYLSRIADVERILNDYSVYGYMTARDGIKIAYRKIMVSNAVGTIVIVHGFTESYAKYSELAWYFINAGYNVFMYDHRGHGLSDRQTDNLETVHLNRFEDYVDDMQDFFEQILLPSVNNDNINVFAHSMGGGITTLYLMRENCPIKRAFLSSTLVGLTAQNCPGWLLRCLVLPVGLLGGWDKKFKFSSDFRPDHPYEQSNDNCYPRFKHNLDLRVAEPRYQTSSFTYGWIYRTSKAQKNILSKKGLKNIRAKVKIMNAGRDTVVLCKPQIKLAKRLGCEFVSMSKAKHSLYTSCAKELEKYVTSVLEFFAL